MIPTPKSVGLVGCGVETRDAAVYFVRHGIPVTMYCEANDSSEHIHCPVIINDFSGLAACDLVLRSPGIRPDVAYLKDLRGIVTTPTGYALSMVAPRAIGVTGTKGKGTTSTLIAAMLQEAGQKVFVGGNIGVPLLSQIEHLSEDTQIVVELSSFQLQDVLASPHIAVILMVMPEHQDWHTSIEEYQTAKQGIVRYQTAGDYCISNIMYPLSQAIAAQSPAHQIFVQREGKVENGISEYEGYVTRFTNGNVEHIIAVKDIALLGPHNWENVAAACGAGVALGVDYAAMARAIRSFTGLPHRLEIVGEVRGVRYVNDSFSTTPETAIAAIQAFTEPKVLILGGSTKGSDFTELAKVIGSSTSIRGIIGIGVEWQKIKAALAAYTLDIPIVEDKTTMPEMLQAAKELAQSGDVVLLSPGCASFGLFANYKDRGNQFREGVSSFSKATAGRENG